MLKSGVIAVDNGGHSTVIVTSREKVLFPSVKGIYTDGNLSETVGKYDYIVEYKNKTYVMGTLAQYDCKLPLQMHTNTKQNIFYDLSVLVSIHQFGFANNYLVTSVPIVRHTDDEKFGIIERLIGEHTVTVNGQRKTFNIMDIKVAPESAVAYWINENQGKSRFLDLGSRTVGYATTINENETTRFIDFESGTFEKTGIEALELSGSYSPQGLADYICGRLLSFWNEKDVINILGGGALDKDLVKHINEYFPNAKVMDESQYVNAKGMYVLGRIAFNLN